MDRPSRPRLQVSRTGVYDDACLPRSHPDPGPPAIPLLLQMGPVGHNAQEGSPKSRKARGLGAIPDSVSRPLLRLTADNQTISSADLPDGGSSRLGCGLSHIPYSLLL